VIFKRVAEMAVRAPDIPMWRVPDFSGIDMDRYGLSVFENHLVVIGMAAQAIFLL
jgi:hypothetical protein